LIVYGFVLEEGTEGQQDSSGDGDRDAEPVIRGQGRHGDGMDHDPTLQVGVLR
jgi:hypothetical protein